MENVYLTCLKEGGKLRVKIISSGYNNKANCQFPRNIRIEGRKYEVPQCAVRVGAGRNGTFFYRIAKNLIKVLDDVVEIPDKIYKLEDCCVCLSEACEIVLVDCGHLCLCKDCSDNYEKNTCPICRGNIKQRINKDQLV